MPLIQIMRSEGFADVQTYEEIVKLLAQRMDADVARRECEKAIIKWHEDNMADQIGKKGKLPVEVVTDAIKPCLNHKTVKLKF